MGGEAEWYIGTRGGMMDHATMMFAEEGGMLKLEFTPFEVKLIEDGLGCRWFSVFTHPADKGGPVRDAFNELTFVQREIIPSYLEGSTDGIELEQLMERLPEAIEHEKFGLVRVRDRFQFVMNEYNRSTITTLSLRMIGDIFPLCLIVRGMIHAIYSVHIRLRWNGLLLIS